MHELKLLHKKLSTSCSIHKTRLDRLITCVNSILQGSYLTLSSIGELSKGHTSVKHKIKAVDRLLGNHHIQNDKKQIYKVLAHSLLSSRPTPEIFVDWSTCNTRAHQVIRASALFDGRSITIYEEIYHETEHNKKSTHKIFLDNLFTVIPSHCKPIIITDAGFRTDWFKMVLKLGWDFIGRIRNRMNYYDINLKKWLPCQKIEVKKLDTAHFVGNVQLTMRNRLSANLFSYKGKSKGRTTNKGKKDKQYAYRKSYLEPWILATSLEKLQAGGRRVVHLYSKRMQIEQTFKDLKDPVTGIGLTQSRTKYLDRLKVLFLIARLAEYVLLIIGVAAEQASLQFSYQANSVRYKRILSYQFLAKRIILNDISKISLQNIKKAIEYIATFEDPHYA
jgi:hypothetical protein